MKHISPMTSAALGTLLLSAVAPAMADPYKPISKENTVPHTQTS